MDSSFGTIFHDQRLISSTTMGGNAAVHKEFPADNRSVFPSSKVKTVSP